MKKPYFAVIILLLLLAGTLLNIWFLDSFITELCTQTEGIAVCAEAGDFIGAAERLNLAMQNWNHASGYTHVVLRHTEIDAVSDIFYDLKSCLLTQDNESALGVAQKLTAHLKGIASMEHISFGSIF